MLGPGGPPGPDCTWSVEFQTLPVGPPSYAVYFPFWPTVTVQCEKPCVFAVGPHDAATVQPVELVGPLFAATAGPDTVFPLHSGNPNASVDLDHAMPGCRPVFLVANPRREFSLSCAMAARDESGITLLKAEFMYCLIVRLWGQETERILAGSL